MSTYWGFRCKEDGDSSPEWFNHGTDLLRHIAEQREHLVAIAKSDLANEVLFELRWISDDCDEIDPADWLGKHEGHEIELHNEYGDAEPC